MDQVVLSLGVAEGPGRLTDVRDLTRQRDGIADRGPTDLVEVRPGRVGDRHRLRRIERGDVLEHAALEATLVFVGEVRVVDARARDVETHPQAAVEIRVVSAQAPLNPLQPARQRHALFLRVIQRRAIARVLAPAREREIVIMCDRRARDRVFPVGVVYDPEGISGKRSRRLQDADFPETGGIEIPQPNLLAHKVGVLRATEYVEATGGTGGRRVPVVLEGRSAS